MAFVKSGTGSRSYIKYAECEPEDVLVEGYYVGEETSKFKNQVYIFKQKEDSSVVCLNAAGKLTKWIEEEVETGYLVKIVYKGKTTIANGPMAGKAAHDFEFFIDDEQSGAVSKANQFLAKPAATEATASKGEKFNKFADEAL